MAVPTLYVVHGLMLPSAAFLSQLIDGRVSAGIIPSTQFASGHPQPLALHVNGQRPAVTFSTKQLATLLTATGVFGYDSSGGNLDFYLKKAADLGVRVADGTAEHLRYRAVQGLLNWTNISVAQDGDAVASCGFVPTYNGSVAPLVPAGTVVLAGTPTAAEVYTLGPVTINSSAISGVTGWSLDLGLQLYNVASDGEPYTTFVGVNQIEPVITIRGINAVNQITYAFAGSGVGTGWSLALRRKAADGSDVANGTSSHIVISGGAAIIEPTDNSGAGNDPVQSELRLRLRATGAGSNALGLAIGTTIT